MELIGQLAHGFGVALQLHNLYLCLIGVLVGTLVGVLPGLGPVASMALLMPLTYSLGPTGAVIMFAGIYYGAMYGGSTTSILLNIPGEAASVMTCVDGHVMAKQGRAGAALGIAAFGSFIAGTLAIIGLTLIAAPLARFALKFSYPEYVALMVLGLMLVVVLASGSMLKAFAMLGVGLVLSSVGQDVVSGMFRFTYNQPTLMDGFDLGPMIMGLFGVSEVLANINAPAERVIVRTRIKDLLPTKEDWRRSIGAILRGTGLGFLLGALPGGGAIVSSFASYAVEKKVSRHPEQFGKGAIEGVAGPESANNAASVGSFVPLLTFGIPSNITMAIVMGALMINGVTPGPTLITERPELFWGVIASMYIGNAVLLVLNLPLIGVWVQVLKVPYRLLFPLILVFCAVGSYSMNNNLFDVYMMTVFGVIGYLMKRHGYEPAILVLAFVIGPILEQSLRQSLLLGEGNFAIFFTRPISATLIAIAAILVASSAIPAIGRRRRAMVAAAAESNN
ncbi:MAG TPA: tripartite tricarboxylate transporter permease [Burkholderiales bacterium]|nr:tripartite tricarboxylate transporter permease [Burkholderiales bacterium]HEX2650737.1 tripartite tricarboxylate transporter permease [Burkholderiales bacterium]